MHGFIQVLHLNLVMSDGASQRKQNNSPMQTSKDQGFKYVQVAVVCDLHHDSFETGAIGDFTLNYALAFYSYLCSIHTQLKEYCE